MEGWTAVSPSNSLVYRALALCSWIKELEEVALRVESWGWGG